MRVRRPDLSERTLRQSQFLGLRRLPLKADRFCDAGYCSQRKNGFSLVGVARYAALVDSATRSPYTEPVFQLPEDFVRVCGNYACGALCDKPCLEVDYCSSVSAGSNYDFAVFCLDFESELFTVNVD